jgi:hypothetical protein
VVDKSHRITNEAPPVGPCDPQINDAIQEVSVDLRGMVGRTVSLGGSKHTERYAHAAVPARKINHANNFGTNLNDERLLRGHLLRIVVSRTSASAKANAQIVNQRQAKEQALACPSTVRYATAPCCVGGRLRARRPSIPTTVLRIGCQKAESVSSADPITNPVSAALSSTAPLCWNSEYIAQST